MNFEKEAREIEMIYETAAKDLMALVGGIDTETYSERAASRVRERAASLVYRLNRAALRWIRRKVKNAYDEERDVSANRLLAFGAKRDKRFDLGRHAGTVKRIVDGMFKDLYRANESMKTIVNQYLDLVREGAGAAKQLQAFTVGEKARIGDLVQNALVEGESRGKLRRRIMDYLKDRLNGDKFIMIRGRNYRIGKYIDLVAGVRLREAATEATINSAREYDHDLVEIPYKMNSCPKCIPYEGIIYSLSGETPGYPVLEVRTPIHPRCLLPGTHCISPGGFVTGDRMLYRGDAIKFTFADSRELAVTPNHMLLTPHGFAAANLLREGNDIFYCPDFERIVSCDPNKNGSPTLVEDIFGSLQKSFGVTARTMPVSPEYFHGDGRFSYGDVDIIGTDSLGKNAGKAMSPQPVGQMNLPAPDVGLFDLLGSRNFTSEFKRLAFAANSIMGGPRTSRALLGSFSAMRNPGSLAGGSFGNADFPKNETDVLISDPIMFSDIAFKITGKIKINKILKIDLLSYHGFVYDFETPTSLYVCNGILSSNCRHYTRVVSMGRG